jgi:hypothetical protein
MKRIILIIAILMSIIITSCNLAERQYNRNVIIKAQPFIDSLNTSKFQNNIVQTQELVGSFALYTRFLNDHLVVVNSTYGGSYMCSADSFNLTKLKYLVVSDVIQFDSKTITETWKKTTRYQNPFQKDEVSIYDVDETKITYEVHSRIFDLKTYKCVSSRVFYGYRIKRSDSVHSRRIENLDDYRKWLSVLFSNEEVLSNNDIYAHQLLYQ